MPRRDGSNKQAWRRISQTSSTSALSSQMCVGRLRRLKRANCCALRAPYRGEADAINGPALGGWQLALAAVFRRKRWRLIVGREISASSNAKVFARAGAAAQRFNRAQASQPWRQALALRAGLPLHQVQNRPAALLDRSCRGADEGTSCGYARRRALRPLNRSLMWPPIWVFAIRLRVAAIRRPRRTPVIGCRQEPDRAAGNSTTAAALNTFEAAQGHRRVIASSCDFTVKARSVPVKCLNSTPQRSPPPGRIEVGGRQSMVYRRLRQAAVAWAACFRYVYRCELIRSSVPVPQALRHPIKRSVSAPEADELRSFGRPLSLRRWLSR